ncbi:MAG: radical SAM protein [Elusimicrobia bacterium]|nr:radical SAM protein [Elusimicrobiota bacterium]
MKLSETYQRYALGLAKARAGKAGRPGRRSALLGRLARLGVKGWPERMTLRTGELPRGCVPCLKGRGSNVSLTTLCSRECFFCFNPLPRADDLSVHGRAAGSIKEAGSILARLAPASVGISGGEPLLFPDRVLALAREIRKRLPRAWIDLYTNGDPLTRAMLEELKAAGVGSLRLNLAANGYDLAPVRLALPSFPDLAVEIPVIPGHEARLRRMALGLASLGARHLILHELFCSGPNEERLRKAGLLKGSAPVLPPGLTWAGVGSSSELCLRLLAWALKRKLELGLYYCSTGTQQWIAENALKSGNGGLGGRSRHGRA